MRRLARQRKPPPLLELTSLVTRVMAGSTAHVVEERANGVIIRFAGDPVAGLSLTCLLHRPPDVALTPAESAVVRELCAGRTLAQIAHLRGVSRNTVKSQARHIFRKFDVESRVELLRLLGP